MIEIFNKADVTNIVISGDIGSMFENGYTLDKLKSEVPEGIENVIVDLKTLGGDSDEAVAVYDYLKSLPSIVTTRMIGNTASAGFTIWMAGDVREVSQHSKGLIHRGMTNTKGNVDDHEQAIDMLNEHDEKIANIYHEVTGKREPLIKNLMKSAKWMTSDELVKWNFATKVIEQKKPILNNADMDTTNIRTILNVADDTGIEAAVGALQAENVRLAGIVNQIEADKHAAELAEHTTFIENAVTEGKITADVKDHYMAIPFENAKALIEAAKPAPLISNIIQGEQPEPEMSKDDALKIYNQHKVKNTLGRWFEANPEEFKKVNAIIRGK